ncbi:hypothetical protein DERF_003543 [Dermatophagoides farinae]|uniref:Uncharacterized protein n=1 Tax=Dermatophagoides farinae TaxID=6954 RepID=A0A922ICT4_DERFA|nr:hypothetical protein DERF_003543 [Dermatophagoides farinae]
MIIVLDSTKSRVGIRCIPLLMLLLFHTVRLLYHNSFVEKRQKTEMAKISNGLATTSGGQIKV